MNRTNLTRRGFLGLTAALVPFALAGCTPTPGGSDEPAAEQTAEAENVTVRVASMKGPTSIGLAAMMGQEGTPWQFNVFGTADEVVQKVVSGDVDVALVPANVASVLYHKTDGGVKAIDINTLSVLELIDVNGSVSDFTGLAGKTVLMTGKGTTPQYVLEYLLGKAGIKDQVTLEYASEASEVVGKLAQQPEAVALLPQPYATAALSKVEGAQSLVNLGEVWKQYAPEGSELVTGVTIVRTEFLEQAPEAVGDFLEAQANSVMEVNADPEAAAKIVAEKGIIDNEAVVAKAIPQCGIVCINGSDLPDVLGGYLEVLCEADPASVGGSVPSDDFYWSR